MGSAFFNLKKRRVARFGVKKVKKIPISLLTFTPIGRIIKARTEKKGETK